MPMKNPVHPGRIVRHDCLEPLGLSVTAGAKILGVTRQALNNIVNGKSGISPEMAIRLTKAFGSTEETWLRMQLAYDLAAARKNESKIKVRRQLVAAGLARALTPDASEVLWRGFPGVVAGHRRKAEAATGAESDCLLQHAAAQPDLYQRRDDRGNSLPAIDGGPRFKIAQKLIFLYYLAYPERKER